MTFIKLRLTQIINYLQNIYHFCFHKSDYNIFY